MDRSDDVILVYILECSNSDQEFNDFEIEIWTRISYRPHISVHFGYRDAILSWRSTFFEYFSFDVCESSCSLLELRILIWRGCAAEFAVARVCRESRILDIDPSKGWSDLIWLVFVKDCHISLTLKKTKTQIFLILWSQNISCPNYSIRKSTSWSFFWSSEKYL